MGVSTDGQICYGIAFEEEYEFPWDDERWDGDIDQWWRDANAYWNPEANPYTPEGNYQPHLDENDPMVEAMVEAWHAHQSRWDKQNPMPVSVVNYCSAECPMYILAVPGSCRNNNRGDALAFVPAGLVVTPAEVTALVGFCKSHALELDDGLKPLWLLSSYYG